MTLLRVFTLLLLLLPSANAQEQETSGGGNAKVEVLTDTRGVDIAPYVQKIIVRIRANWYSAIPHSAKAPEFKSGTAKIEFSIAGDGKVNGIKLVASSGDRELDRAAWTGVSDSNPLPKLPKPLRKEGMSLRLTFVYNPSKR